MTSTISPALLLQPPGRNSSRLPLAPATWAAAVGWAVGLWVATPKAAFSSHAVLPGVLWVSRTCGRPHRFPLFPFACKLMGKLYLSAVSAVQTACSLLNEQTLQIRMKLLLMINELISYLQRSQSHNAAILFPPLLERRERKGSFFPFRIFKSGTTPMTL